MNKKKPDPVKLFEEERADRLLGYSSDETFRNISQAWLEHAFKTQYMYNFDIMGRPIIQLPTDICAMQELVWKVKPDVIIETGIAHGGSLVLSASLLALLDLCDATASGVVLDPKKPKRQVIGVDIDIRSHNRLAIESHPMANRIKMIQGSSIDPKIVEQVRIAAAEAKKVLVCLDSNHTHDHVLAELQHYAPMVSVDSYCIVFDTIIQKLPSGSFPNRPWAQGDNAMTAVDSYLKECELFEIDNLIDAKLQISAAPRGYLKRVV